MLQVLVGTIQKQLDEEAAQEIIDLIIAGNLTAAQACIQALQNIGGE